ncbi:3-deoxy-manno-octulosonate cytidylyltransferase [Candidatus Pelagibacter sp.]|nr:3-deoxy-manno-octulosonate cytidylyltransferase [Candidatus Pelagibacter sp.]
MKTLVIIPSRLSAERLPGKPLMKIEGLSIISHVFKKAEEANIGEVIVAAEDQEIVDDVKQNGGQAILTKNEHKTGTDRIYEVFQKINSADIDLVMNLQGDEPLMNIEDIRNLNKKMIESSSKLGTLASKIKDKSLLENPSVVKVLTKENLSQTNFPEAENFMRNISQEKENIYHHLGVYSYNKDTLEKFVSLNQSTNEIKNKLEQLRALDNDIKINVAFANFNPIGVDTVEDLEAVKKIMENKS